MLEAVIFDMDGVIIDSEPIYKMVEEEIFESLNISVMEEEFNKYIGTNSYYLWKCIKENHGLENSIGELVKLERESNLNYLLKHKELIKPVEGVVKLIQDIHNNGIKLSVASSSPIELISTIIDTIGIRKYFDYIVTGDYVDKCKPEPDVFLYAANKLNIEPSKCMVIEDSKNGTIAAKKAGMRCLGYKNLNSGNQDLSKADKITDSFCDVKFIDLQGVK